MLFSFFIDIYIYIYISLYNIPIIMLNLGITNDIL